MELEPIATKICWNCSALSSSLSPAQWLSRTPQPVARIVAAPYHFAGSQNIALARMDSIVSLRVPQYRLPSCSLRLYVALQQIHDKNFTQRLT
jgi:hypothetical protein